MLSEYHAKKAYREKRAREKLKEKELKEKMDAEALKLKAEQDKMQKDMDKFFDASGAVVSTNICLIEFSAGRLNLHKASFVQHISLF